MTNELLTLCDWLAAEQCTHVVMESTASFWRPIYNVLEGQAELLVVKAAHVKAAHVKAAHVKAAHVKAAHVKAVPGRKTDVKDAEWLAELLRHGLVRGSFIPSPTQRQLRDLTRYRMHLIEERARLTNRVQVALEDANIKLASVVTDVRGVSARAIVHALMGGQTDPQALAELAELAELAGGRLRSKRDLLAQAVVGRLTAHHAFLLTEQRAHLDDLEEAIARVSAEIDRRLTGD
jgi:transposase